MDFVWNLDSKGRVTSSRFTPVLLPFYSRIRYFLAGYPFGSTLLHFGWPLVASGTLFHYFICS